MSPLVYVMQQNILLLLGRAPNDTVRESLHVLYNAAKDIAVTTANLLAAWQTVAAEPYREDLLAAAVAMIHPDGVPDERKVPPIKPTPPPAPVDATPAAPAEQPA